MRSIAVFFLVATTAVVDAGEVQLKIPVEPNSREVVVTGQGLSGVPNFSLTEKPTARRLSTGKRGFGLWGM